MKLYYEKPDGVFTLWGGSPIDGIKHARNIGQSGMWSDEELAAIGLYRPEAATPLNEGRVLVSQSVKRVSGVVKYVNVTAAEPEPSTDPRDYELSAAQFEYLLVDSELDDALDAAKVSTKAARGNSPADKEAEAQFKMALKGSSFNFDATLAMVATLAPHIPVGVTLDEATLTPHWLKAAAQI